MIETNFSAMTSKLYAEWIKPGPTWREILETERCPEEEFHDEQRFDIFLDAWVEHSRVVGPHIIATLVRAAGDAQKAAASVYGQMMGERDHNSDPMERTRNVAALKALHEALDPAVSKTGERPSSKRGKR